MYQFSSHVPNAQNKNTHTNLNLVLHRIYDQIDAKIALLQLALRLHSNVIKIITIYYDFKLKKKRQTHLKSLFHQLRRAVADGHAMKNEEIRFK